MPATPARIGFITNEFRRVSNGPDAGVVAKYGEAARRTEVVETFFEAQADAQAMCDARRSFLGADRRRLSQTISGEQTGIGLNYTLTTPAVTVIDDRREANHTALVSSIEIDFENETTTLETWG